MACKQCRSLPMLLFMVVNSTIGGNNFFGSSGNIVSHIIFHKRYYLLSFRPKTWSRFLNLTMLKKLLHRSKFSSIWNNGIYSVRKKYTVFRRLRMFLRSYFLSRYLHPWLMTLCKLGVKSFSFRSLSFKYFTPRWKCLHHDCAIQNDGQQKKTILLL